MPRAAFAASFLTAALVAGFHPPAAAQNLTEQDKTIHLLQRATFGVRPEDVTTVMTQGRERWLDQQLRPDRIDDRPTAARLEQYESLKSNMGDMIAQFQAAQLQRRTDAQARQMADTTMQPVRRVRALGLPPQAILAELVIAKLTRAVYSERQLEEMMTDFWFNHFNVYFNKGLDRYMTADYEANAIRPHVFGKFRDLLGATAKHPAMLFYLDNAQS
ncbi:MAG TPA: DUF1800 family protein, partial [Longimicrobiales bacterium]|nr:DUF1800 family protein [Longimicrobiales bacterium]